jgi:stearoyl-CoA desaturase (delta-9 desaturase)
MALVTLGEGYHNYHHEFQHDYRNGVKPWQFDPTKWLIWALAKVGLARKLRRVPETKVALAELAEAQRRLQERLAHPGLSPAAAARLTGAYARLQAAAQRWGERKAEQLEGTGQKVADELRQEVGAAIGVLRRPHLRKPEGLVT